MVLCFAVGLIFLSFFAWRIYLSNEIAGGYLTPAVEISSQTIKTIDKKKLEADILIWENKQADYLMLKSKPNKLIDPAL